MKAFSLFSLLLAMNFMGPKAHAFKGYDQFKVEIVKPWGEFGFRALGRGMNISEMRLNCGQATDMGLVLSVVNKYGKTSHTVLPAKQLGADKETCQSNLKKYFANLYFRRGLASSKDKDQIRTLELNFESGGLFSDVERKNTLRFH